MEKLQANEIYDFGKFRLDAGNHLLRHGEKTVALTPREFELLLLFVQNPQRIMSKDELLEQIWKDTFVEEGTLTRNISWLRKKLEAASGGAEKFIETVPKRGYRFFPEVARMNGRELVIEAHLRQLVSVEETLTIDDAEQQQEFEPQESRDKLAALPASPERRKVIWLIVLLSVVAAAAISFIIYQKIARRSEAKTILTSRVVPFSGLPGREDMPSFSPDGKQMAFVWNGGEGDATHIYVKLIGTGEPLQLTNAPDSDIYPTFAPEGSQVAFVRSFKTHSEVFLVPALGGAEHRICSLNVGGMSVSFSPDGKTLAVVDTDADSEQYAIFLLDLQTGAKRRLTAPSGQEVDHTPRFSPDGKSVAFLRLFGSHWQELFVAPASGGAARQLTHDKAEIRSLAWSANSQRIIFVSLRLNNQSNLWQIDMEGNAPQLIAVSGKDIWTVAADASGRTLAFVDETADTDIWRIEPNGPARKFIISARPDHSPAISPDGSRIVFVSDRTGQGEIWITDADGKNQRQLTDSPNPVGSPRFSPDGRLIAYDSQTRDGDAIFIVPSEGGTQPRRLTDKNMRAILPSWSTDGQWIFFTSDQAGGWNIWKIRTAGGEAVQVTKHGAFESFASPDGKEIFYSKSRGVAGLWRTPVEGGAEEPIPELNEAGYWRSWTVTQKGVYYVAYALNPPFHIRFYDFASGQTREIATTEKSPLWYSAGLGASEDGRTILYAQSEQSSRSIMLAEIEK